MKSVGQLDVPDTISWVDEERDASCWLGNAMQREAFNKLYSVADRLLIANDPRINQDWDYLQASNNFRFMTTKPSNVGLDRGIYSGPFDAFTNYMNILGDFINRVNALYPLEIDNEELNSLLTTIRNQGDEIEVKDKEITRLKARLEKLESDADTQQKACAKKESAKKAPAKKAAVKKSSVKKEIKNVVEESTEKKVDWYPIAKKSILLDKKMVKSGQYGHIGRIFLLFDLNVLFLCSDKCYLCM